MVALDVGAARQGSLAADTKSRRVGFETRDFGHALYAAGDCVRAVHE